MFTVLIAEKEHIDAIRQENKLFFEPFLESKDLAFCYWNSSGQNLLDSVPGLMDTVGRRREWRAVILNNTTPDTLKAQNPFDVVDNSPVSVLTAPERQPGPDESWDEWEAEWKNYYQALAREKETVCRSALEHPLQKLATWLCFRPEDYILNEVQEKQDIHDWAIEMINKDSVKPSARLEALERDHYKFEQRMKETVRREFMGSNYLNIAYPSEIHCISLRTSENSFFDPDKYWNIRSDSDYSAFADRNMYFDRMRFMVFDLLPSTHRDFRNDYIRFLATVLIFVSNPMPASAMQARRLYNLEIETDDTPLCTMVTSYDRKLEATLEVIENEMERIRGEIPEELSDKAAEELFCTPADVPVILDKSCKLDKVYAEKNYGLCFDIPENEFYKWNRSYKTSEETLSYIVKQQSRSVRKSVKQAKLASEINDVNVSRLTSLQIEDVRDYTNSAENDMVDSIPKEASGMSRYKERMLPMSENVKKKIGRRMSFKATAILTAICLGLYIACFLPFLLANNNTAKTVSTAVVLIGIMVGVLAIIMFIALLFMRLSVINAVKDYNNTLHDIMSEIMTSLQDYSKYLSASCNVRRGHAVQKHAQDNLDEYTKSLRIRKKHQEDIRKRRAYLLEDYGDYFGDRSFWDDTMVRPYDYDFDLKTEYDYPAPFLAGDCRQIEFMSSGNYVTVPSSFVTRILVRMEGIYDK